jgi:hypothetical protein
MKSYRLYKKYNSINVTLLKNILKYLSQKDFYINDIVLENFLMDIYNLYFYVCIGKMPYNTTHYLNNIVKQYKKLYNLDDEINIELILNKYKLIQYIKDNFKYSLSEEIIDKYFY